MQVNKKYSSSIYCDKGRTIYETNKLTTPPSHQISVYYVLIGSNRSFSPKENGSCDCGPSWKCWIWWRSSRTPYSARQQGKLARDSKGTRPSLQLRYLMTSSQPNENSDNESGIASSTFIRLWGFAQPTSFSEHQMPTEMRRMQVFFDDLLKENQATPTILEAFNGKRYEM